MHGDKHEELSILLKPRVLRQCIRPNVVRLCLEYTVADCWPYPCCAPLVGDGVSTLVLTIINLSKGYPIYVPPCTFAMHWLRYFIYMAPAHCGSPRSVCTPKLPWISRKIVNQSGERRQHHSTTAPFRIELVGSIVSRLSACVWWDVSREQMPGHRLLFFGVGRGRQMDQGAICSLIFASLTLQQWSKLRIDVLSIPVAIGGG